MPHGFSIESNFQFSNRFSLKWKWLNEPWRPTHFLSATYASTSSRGDTQRLHEKLWSTSCTIFLKNLKNSYKTIQFYFTWSRLDPAKIDALKSVELLEQKLYQVKSENRTIRENLLAGMLEVVCTLAKMVASSTSWPHKHNMLPADNFRTCKNSLEYGMIADQKTEWHRESCCKMKIVN